MKVAHCAFVVLFTALMDICHGIDNTKLHKSDRNQVYYIEPGYSYDWHQALTACNSMNMTLLTIENKDKSDAINRLVLKTFGKNVVLWVGGHRVGTSNEFNWIATGQKFVYSFWHNNQPDFAGRVEFCAQIGWAADMKWNDNQCHLRYGYVCEYPSNVKCRHDESALPQKYANFHFNFNNRH